MPSRIKRRSGAVGWRILEISGWLFLAVGLACAARIIGTAVHRSAFGLEEVTRGLSAFLSIFFGSVVVVGSRQSDTHYHCSGCGTELERGHDRACPRCRTFLD